MEAGSSSKKMPSTIIRGVLMGMVSMFTVSCTPHRTKELDIAGTRYFFPLDLSAVVTLNEGRPYASYTAADWSYRLVYHSRYQSGVNEAGQPSLHFITNRFDDPSIYQRYDTPVGIVTCNREHVRVGMKFQCGTSFIHRGARWQLHFDANQVGRASALKATSFAALASLRKPPVS
jgi:hypothetical protein